MYDIQSGISGISSNTWPTFSETSPFQVDFNVSGGFITEINYTLVNNGNMQLNLPVLVGNTSNNFSLVNAYSWEAGRGRRCDLWRDIGSMVPY